MIKTKFIVQCLRLIWVLLILSNEFFVFKLSARNCAFISPVNYTNTPSINNGRILLVADPQMTDDNSYNRPWIILQLSKFYSKLYMMRNYQHLESSVRPTDTIILGDLMDSGRDWDDIKYASEVDRFRRIFPSKAYYMVGNHDVGFGNGIQKHLVERFEGYFGPTSYTFEKYGHVFVIVDTVSLSASNPVIRNDALHMLESLSSNSTKPRILMTHVPLFRSPQQTCGPQRQSGAHIADRAGYQYQNLVTDELTSFILNKVDPVAVFSGDDHDYCKTVHVFGNNHSAVEITVPTFSMAQGLKYPGVMVLNIEQGQLTTTDLCWLPDQIGLFLRYTYLLVFTVTLLLTWHVFQCAFRNSANSANSAGYHLAKEELGVQHIQFKSTKRSMLPFFYSIRDVAWVGILAYIICILIL